MRFQGGGLSLGNSVRYFDLRTEIVMNRLFSGRIGHIGAVMGASAPIVSTALPILFITCIDRNSGSVFHQFIIRRSP
jgi:hypothetical protein